MSDNCPCCSGMQYNLCCQPYLSGDAIPDTPEALMRSRYTAWALHDVDYLIATWHPFCRTDKLRQTLTDAMRGPQWISLKITGCESGGDSNEGFVTFFARYIEKKQTGAIHERSRFLRKDHRWYYIDGTTPRIARNDPCPCGSQKKYKKCCGQ